MYIIAAYVKWFLVLFHCAWAVCKPSFSHFSAIYAFDGNVVRRRASWCCVWQRLAARGYRESTRSHMPYERASPIKTCSTSNTDNDQLCVRNIIPLLFVRTSPFITVYMRIVLGDQMLNLCIKYIVLVHHTQHIASDISSFALAICYWTMEYCCCRWWCCGKATQCLTIELCANASTTIVHGTFLMHWPQQQSSKQPLYRHIAIVQRLPSTATATTLPMVQLELTRCSKTRKCCF